MRNHSLLPTLLLIIPSFATTLLSAQSSWRKAGEWSNPIMLRLLTKSMHVVDKSNRSLLGHSFGGYFSLYALLNQLQTNRSPKECFGHFGVLNTLYFLQYT